MPQEDGGGLRFNLAFPLPAWIRRHTAWLRHGNDDAPSAVPDTAWQGGPSGPMPVYVVNGKDIATGTASHIANQGSHPPPPRPAVIPATWRRNPAGAGTCNEQCDRNNDRR